MSKQSGASLVEDLYQQMLQDAYTACKSEYNFIIFE